jgi:glutamate-5-semialdehyde dehydrogenase
MAVADSIDLRKYCLQTAQQARAASVLLARTGGAVKNAWLRRAAERLRGEQQRLATANAKDLDAAPGYGLTDAQIDRLRLTPKVIEAMAVGLEEISQLPEPIGEVIESTIRPNGLEILKVRVPIGVVFFIYESRPNVTADAAGICIKSGNAVILRGGKEAIHSNQAIAEILETAAAEVGLPDHAVQLVNTTDREAVGHFLGLNEFIDLAIPRGGESLIRRVAAEAKMPVIKHFTGNCHVYVDQAADPDMAEQITVNSKCQRLGVCNAAESLLVHAAVAPKLLPRIAEALIAQGIEIRGDAPTRRLVPQAKTATDEDYAAEYLAPIISVKVVDDLEAAMAHINRFGSKHTDAIVTNDLSAARQFVTGVDTAAVMVNASTRFNDGGEFGLGAEIGISTDKFHARGPCGIKELTSYKYVAYGTGQIRK